MRALPLLIVLLFSTLLNAQSINHVEPPFWWVGMKNANLQVMVHGDDIASSTPMLSYEGVEIKKINKVENPNYLFIDLKIASDTKPGKFDLVFGKGKKNRYSYELKARAEGSTNRQGFTNADVMYLITPDRFANGNPENDNMDGMKEQANRDFHGGRHGGDIKGIADNLDYLDDLGITAIWVNPVLENNMESYSYHGYSTTDFYKVDPRFGSNEEYLALSQQASEKGIKMIMDMIVNHCGSEHWWMADLPTSDWINNDNQFMQTNHQKPVIQDPYRSASDYRQMVDGWFVRTMPDLNQRNPYMATYLIQNAIWWIEFSGLAGIRMDTYPYADMDFMTQWTCAIMEEYPNFNITGEEWSDNPNIVAHWQAGKINANGYTSCLPSLIDFPMRQALQNSLGSRSFFPLYQMQANDFVYADPTRLVVFADNHDMDRFYTQVGEDMGKFKMGMVHVLTTRGTPQIYYGTEILFTNNMPDHGVIRQDYPGGWAGDAVNAFTDEGLTEQQIEARKFLQQLMTWRQDKEVIHSGELMHFVPYDNIYVVFRYNEEETIMVVFNLNEENIELQLGRFEEMLTDANAALNVMTGETIPLDETLILPANAPIILEIKK